MYLIINDLFLGAKVRRFPYTHNPDFVAYYIPNVWYNLHFAYKKAMRRTQNL